MLRTINCFCVLSLALLSWNAAFSQSALPIQIQVTENPIPIEGNYFGFNMAKFLEQYDWELDSIAPINEGELSSNNAWQYIRDLSTNGGKLMLRFPGGGKQSAYMHLDSDEPGYGFDFTEVIGNEILGIADELSWEEFYCQQSGGIAPGVDTIPCGGLPDQLPADAQFLDKFIFLNNAVLPNNAEVLYTANIITSTPFRQKNILVEMINAGVNVKGVEMGNEMYIFKQYNNDDDYVNYWGIEADTVYPVFPEGSATLGVEGRDAARRYLYYLAEKPYVHAGDTLTWVGMLEEIFVETGVDLELGLCVAPTVAGNDEIITSVTNQNFYYFWNLALSTYREAEWIDAFIPHIYARKPGYWLRTPTDSFYSPEFVALADTGSGTDLVLNYADAAFDAIWKALPCYFEDCDPARVDDDILRRQFGELGELFKADSAGVEKSFWVTEWNTQTGDFDPLGGGPPQYNLEAIGNTYMDMVFSFQFIDRLIDLNSELKDQGLNIGYANKQIFQAESKSRASALTEYNGAYDRDKLVSGTSLGLGYPGCSGGGL